MLRRTFLKSMGVGIVGLTAVSLPGSADVKRVGFSAAGKASVNPRGGAENVIFVFLRGAASHVDTFDLKVGSWTPADFEPTQYGNFSLPAGLFPKLGEQADKFSLLRCLEGNEAVHQRASYLLATGQVYNPVFALEQPHIGSLIAYETAAKRKPTDIFPAFVAMNGDVQGPGMLESTHAAFSVGGGDGIISLDHPAGQAAYEKRWQSLLAIDGAARLGTADIGSRVSDYHNFYASADKLMYEPDVTGAFSVTDEELVRYGDNSTGRSCAMAVKVLAKDLGTRFIQISHGSWDHHYDIYNREDPTGLYGLAGSLDPALASMLADLAATPGKRGGSLLDETLVVVAGEFGRTPADLTGNQGRDHYPYAFAALMAGGGVVPGQAFGATDSQGWSVTDRFWSRNRGVTIHDLVATIYSSMGVDWSKEIQDTPSGRVYEYTPKVNGESGYYTDIAEMFG